MGGLDLPTAVGTVVEQGKAGLVEGGAEIVVVAVAVCVEGGVTGPTLQGGGCWVSELVKRRPLGMEVGSLRQ